VRSATTGADGFYTVPLVAPGPYEVHSTLSGFRGVIRKGVVVTVSETACIDLRMPVASVEDNVTVTAETRSSGRGARRSVS
jgi:hypothetical protein